MLAFLVEPSHCLCGFVSDALRSRKYVGQHNYCRNSENNMELLLILAPLLVGAICLVLIAWRSK